MAFKLVLKGAGSFTMHGKVMREFLESGGELDKAGIDRLFVYTLKALPGKETDGLADRTPLELAKILEKHQSKNGG